MQYCIKIFTIIRYNFILFHFTAYVQYFLSLKTSSPVYSHVIVSWNNILRTDRIEGDILLQRILSLWSKGSDVKEVQSILKAIEYYGEAVSGSLDNESLKAIKKFQGDFGLEVDGIVGPLTFNALNKYIRGYDIYNIKAGDTLFSVSKKYETSLSAIFTANPGVDPLNLKEGQKIVSPYGIDVVRNDVDYTYDIMVKNLEGLKARYPFIEYGVSGKSVLGRNLYYVRLGQGKNQVFFNGSHHGNEWITTSILMKFIEDFSKAYSLKVPIMGYRPAEIWNKCSIYIIPMVNPDGVNLVIDGVLSDNPYRERVIKWNNKSLDFSKWKSNIRGVDLNRNYNAGWELAKASANVQGIYGPSPGKYPGEPPESEPETKALVSFTRSHDFKLALAYHTQGEVIYWTNQGIQPQGSRRIGEMFTKVSGYGLSEPQELDSYSGYKDWFIKEYNRPGFTIEAGKGTNPLHISEFDRIYEDNLEILLTAALV